MGGPRGASIDNRDGSGAVTGQQPQDEDLVETGPPPDRARPRWPRRRLALVGAVVVLAAVGVVIHVGDRADHAGTPRARSSAPPPSGSLATEATLQLDGTSACGTLADGVLSVAFAVLDTGTGGLVLEDVRPVLPLGGLRPVGGLGDHPPTAPGCPEVVLRRGDTVPAGSGGWIALAFRPTTACLSPLPIDVDVVYRSAGRVVTTRLAPFPDLGAVPAAAGGCPDVHPA
jgi:hypothetical protein